MKEQSKPIGIIGGMGPYACAYLYRLLLDESREYYMARDNQDYPEVVIDSLPVPDFIVNLKNLDEARKLLVSRVEKLKQFGCKKIYMACNSGHILENDLIEASDNSFVSLIGLVAQDVNGKSNKRVGILATPTTIRTNLYKDRFNSDKVIFYPDTNLKNELEKVIREVIAGKSDKQYRRLMSLTREFVDRERLDGLVLACTELPLIFEKEKFRDIEITDSLEILAKNILDSYFNTNIKLG